MKKVNEELVLHMPDLLFVRFCEEKFGVNRGVYNTIDEWFFNHGVRQIVERRNLILNFFNTLKLKDRKDEKVKFGSRGLTEKLNEFMQHQKRTEDIQQAKVILGGISIK